MYRIFSLGAILLLLVAGIASAGEMMGRTGLHGGAAIGVNATDNQTFDQLIKQIKATDDPATKRELVRRCVAKLRDTLGSSGAAGGKTGSAGLGELVRQVIEMQAIIVADMYGEKAVDVQNEGVRYEYPAGEDG